MTTKAIKRPAAAGHSWQARLWACLALARVSNSPTVASNVLAGAALAGLASPDRRVAVLAVAMVLFYTAGMYLNDLCDESLDRLERPERPLPAGLVSRRWAWLLTLAMFGGGSGLVALFGWPALVSATVLIALIAAYDSWHKGNPLSPLLMAGCRVLVYVTTFVALGGQETVPLLLASGLLGLYLVGLTYIAKCERRTTLVGWWPAALLFLPALAFVTIVVPGWSWLLPLLFIGWVAYSISFVYRREGRSVGSAIGHLIAGIALLDTLVLVALGSVLGGLLALAAFVLTLFLQRFIRGT